MSFYHFEVGKALGITSGRVYPHNERISIEDHQICFGMDISHGESKTRLIFGTDGNGNSRQGKSIDSQYEIDQGDHAQIA